MRILRILEFFLSFLIVFFKEFYEVRAYFNYSCFSKIFLVYLPVYNPKYKHSPLMFLTLFCKLCKYHCSWLRMRREP